MKLTDISEKKTREYLKEKSNELETNGKNINIRNLLGNDYQSRSNLV
jgi:hypothetical protein